MKKKTIDNQRLKRELARARLERLARPKKSKKDKAPAEPSPWLYPKTED